MADVGAAECDRGQEPEPEIREIGSPDIVEDDDARAEGLGCGQHRLQARYIQVVQDVIR